MRKSWLILLVILLGILFGTVAGIYINRMNKISNTKDMENSQLAKVEDKHEDEIDNTEDVVETSNNEVKISPNAKLIQKVYYDYCDHMIREEEKVAQDLVNKTRKEFQREFSEWKIEEFSEDEITIYQEKKGMCNQHYKIKDTNGVLSVYTIDENGKETLKEVTGVITQYLPEADAVRVQDGIEAVGREQLNSVLEDFE